MSIFKLKQGNHYSKPFKPGFYCGKMVISKRVKFSDECLINPGNSQINKLFGVSLDPLNRNSLRIGWKPHNNKIYLYSYVHEKGKINRNKQIMISFMYTNIYCDMSITITRNLVKFKVGDKQVIIENDNSIRLFGWKMGLYYGGSIPAPANMEVEIEDINTSKNKEGIIQ